MLDAKDRQDIQALFIRYANMIDERQYSRIGEVFSEDAIYDAAAFGLGRNVGIAEIDACLRGAQHPLLHVPVNAEAEEGADGVVRALSRCIAILDDGRVSQCTYHDILIRTARGWRMKERIILPRTPATIPSPT